MMDRGGNPPDRRAVQRIPGDTFGPLELIAEPSADLIAATVWDISVQGIGLLADRPVEPGVPLVIRGKAPAGR